MIALLRTVFLFAAIAVAVQAGNTPAQEADNAGALPLRPGESFPAPRQRTLAEVETVPEKTLACPVCGYSVTAPVADLMVRRPGNLPEDAPTPPWQMHPADRDADLAPYPPPTLLSYQADIVLCPDCGYANTFAAFPNPVTPEAARWVAASLTPELRAAERVLVGRRAEAMTDDELIAFFAHQELLPDTLRTEHYRTWLAAVHAPPLRQAEAARLSAWASRREAAAAPRSALFVRRADVFAAALEKVKRPRPGLPGEVEALRAHMRRLRQGKPETALPGADDMLGRALLAGLYVRLGFLADAEKIYETLFLELRERFLRHEQDPLWPATTQKASVAQRLNELELLRADAEKEMFVKVELVRRERNLLTAAADRIRDAFREGALDGKKEDALFHAYLTAEFLRRAGDLPLAAEWFNNLINLADPDTPVARAARLQLRYTGELAGDTVNLLSALGKNSEVFAKLREICRSGE